MSVRASDGDTAYPTVREPDRARGGVSLSGILSGVLVAIGAFIILAAIVGAIVIATGVADAGIQPTEAAGASIGAGIALVMVQFLSYLWGGYTAGRMARGSGLLNGILVPIVALVLVAILGAVVAVLAGSSASVNPSDVQRLPLPLGRFRDVGTNVGVGLLAAMLLGGMLGGWLGARWHTKLEDKEHERTRG